MWQEQTTYVRVAKTQGVNRQPTRHFKNEVPFLIPELQTREVIPTATRGRKPKPTALKILEGNPGKRPQNPFEPVPVKGDIKCPDWLLPEAKKEWKRLAPALEAMGVLTMADQTAFEGYCQAYARWKECLARELDR